MVIIKNKTNTKPYCYNNGISHNCRGIRLLDQYVKLILRCQSRIQAQGTDSPGNTCLLPLSKRFDMKSLYSRRHLRPQAINLALVNRYCLRESFLGSDNQTYNGLLQEMRVRFIANCLRNAEVSGEFLSLLPHSIWLTFTWVP